MTERELIEYYTCLTGEERDALETILVSMLSSRKRKAAQERSEDEEEE